MLEQLLVELEYPFTANCEKCNSILFQIKIIDQFIKVHDGRNKEKDLAGADAAKFYMLHSQILPSSIFVERGSFLSQTKPFFMQFLGQIKCGSCKERVGIKMLTVSSEFHYPELLNRHLIDTSKVRVKTKKEDVTSQILQRFYQEWDNQTEIDEISLSQKIMSGTINQKKQFPSQPAEQKSNKNIKKQEKIKKQGKIEKNEKKNIRQNNSRESQEVKYLRKQLQQQNEQNKQVVQEIITSIDFFNEVLTSLQKRVSQTQNVCNVLKEKVQKMIPLLRKKNQQ